MKKITFLTLLLHTICLNAQIVITEIMYNGPESGTDITEFIEIYNAGSNPVDLTGYTFVGVVHTIGNFTLNPGEYYVVGGVLGAESIDTVYGAGTADEFWTSGALSNGGEMIQLRDALDNLVDEVIYDDVAPWPTGSNSGEADGGGASLRLCDVNVDNSIGSNWQASNDSPVNATLHPLGDPINYTFYASPGQASQNACTLSTEAVLLPKIFISPNPVKDILTINNINKIQTASIYDFYGRLVLKTEVSENSNTINISDLQSGFYFITLQNYKPIKFLKK